MHVLEMIRVRPFSLFFFFFKSRCLLRVMFLDELQRENTSRYIVNSLNLRTMTLQNVYSLHLHFFLHKEYLRASIFRHNYSKKWSELAYQIETTCC